MILNQTNIPPKDLTEISFWLFQVNAGGLRPSISRYRRAEVFIWAKLKGEGPQKSWCTLLQRDSRRRLSHNHCEVLAITTKINHIKKQIDSKLDFKLNAFHNKTHELAIAIFGAMVMKRFLFAAAMIIGLGAGEPGRAAIITFTGADNSYQIPEAVTLVGGYPNQHLSDSTWRTMEVRHAYTASD